VRSVTAALPAGAYEAVTLADVDRTLIELQVAQL
jgi:hypothetical protein